MEISHQLQQLWYVIILYTYRSYEHVQRVASFATCNIWERFRKDLALYIIAHELCPQVYPGAGQRSRSIVYFISMRKEGLETADDEPEAFLLQWWCDSFIPKSEPLLSP